MNREEQMCFDLMLAALVTVSCTYRTFRNVPHEKQEWTPLDDEVLDNVNQVIKQAKELNS